VAPAELVQKLLGRLSEARLCMEQGLADGIADMIEGILAETERDDLPQLAREEIRSRANSILNSLNEHSDSQPIEKVEFQATDPAQFYSYGLALMDGQFWEEAIQELSMAAGLGFKSLQCWDYCGDCAANLGKWEDAFRFYEYVYSDRSLADEQKKNVLTKIAKCSQAQRKEHARPIAAGSESEKTEPEDMQAKYEPVNPSVLSFDSHSVDTVIGQTVTSRADRSGKTLAACAHSYRVTGLLHVGSSSVIVELEEQNTRQKYAGQAFNGKLSNALPVEKLAMWAKTQMLIKSRHLVRIFDLASMNDHVFIVREHLPLSLSDLLAADRNMPISLAVRLGYQVLEALGDLHLHMALDGRIHNQFHLDLRPSRVLLRSDKPFLKIYNGGLWKEMEKASPARTNLKDLPLPHLCYRAPEQFRTYLARKRPPVFTDIYLFGTLFYEMLTGTPAFNASSLGEYQIQHCEQYPSPPRVWRPEIPEILNDLIMDCLASDPMKRYRSATQISLALEKSFPTEVARPKDDLYRKYLQRLRLV
jgi:serine/threonine protein kinase